MSTPESLSNLNNDQKVYHFVKKWDVLDDIYSIAADEAGYVYAVISDHFRRRVQKFDREGNFVTKWGSYGSADGQFKSPHGIAVDCEGFVYVADTENNRIQKFDRESNFILKWGSNGTADGQFDNPAGIAVDSQGFA